ncbi:MAG: lipopolysaccharide biosynthesis protein [Balneolaceae bacterium]|nr:lipopolysaccharide biosynthesis protein [Balneolaceae bacterium]
MKNLREKTVNGVFWSFIQNFSVQINAFIVGIILARLLSPREFGLIGMLTIFIALSSTLVNSGLKDALIRNPNCTEEDYSTAFFFNVGMSFGLYLILFFSAGLIAQFYNEPELVSLVRVLSITLIINAFILIQKAKLTKELDFKLLTKVDVIASVIAGVIAIAMAFYGFGVWSLVAKTLLISLFTLILYWFWSKWVPKFTFSKQSFKEMFSFGSRLAVHGIIGQIYLSIYYLIIGKYYSAEQLGHYTKADGFKNFPSKGITGIVQKVTYPVLSNIQDDPKRLKQAYRKLTKIISLVTITLLFGLSAVAENFSVLLLGEEWRLTGEFLKILCFSAIFYPLDALNSNMLKVAGKSDIILNIGIARKFMAIPVILSVIFIGIKVMLYVMIVHQFFSFWLISHYGGKTISYGTLVQVKDFTAAVLVSSIMYFAIYMMPFYFEVNILILVSVQILVGAIISIILYELFNVDGYKYLKKGGLEKWASTKK